MKMTTEYFYLAAKNIRRRKLRSWLTVLGIIISIATIFMLISISLGLNNAVAEQFRQLGTDKFFIMPQGTVPGTTGAVTITKNDVNVIEKVNGVKKVMPMSTTTAKISFGDQFRYVYIAGIPLKDIPLYSEAGFIKVDEGRLLTIGDSQQVAIGSQYKLNNVFKRPIRTGNTVQVNGVNFRVKAVLQSVGNPSDDKNVYMSMEDYESIYPAKKEIYDEVIVQVQPGENVSEVAARVNKRLLSFRGVTEKTKDFYILSPEELLATFGTILNVLTGFLLGIAAISLLVGGIGIATTMYTAVLERTKEIGVMKAVGARNSDIAKIFTIEAGMIGMIGGMGGVLFGFIAAKIIEFIAVNMLSTSMLQVATPWYLFVGSLAFSFVIGAVSGIIPALQASKVRPVDALRYE
jgi:putative ABC transport system permease protein